MVGGATTPELRDETPEEVAQDEDEDEDEQQYERYGVVGLDHCLIAGISIGGGGVLLSFLPRW